MSCIKNQSLRCVFMSANREDLLSLLAQAKISTGHWNGRKIEISGFEGQMTFTEIAVQIENHYQAIVEPMQLRKKAYEEWNRSSIDKVMDGPGTPGMKLLMLPFLLPSLLACDILKWVAGTSYPTVNEEEEKKIVSTFIWRKAADSLLDSLFTRSQEEIDRYASTSYVGAVVKVWDFFLDQQSNWRNRHNKDKTTLLHMVRARKKRANSSSVGSQR